MISRIDMKPKKLCEHAGCTTLVNYNQTYCARHQPEPKQSDYDRYENRKKAGGKYFWFYKSKAWKNLSNQYRLKQPLCEDCLKEGLIKAGNVRDHIIPIREDWSKRLDESNIQNLCHYHHNVKTRQERMKSK
ncbi:HNH endonuclease [Tetragenococcus halophilus]|uniref:HNH endonuclease n=1 Tax=Tetragenococcus halophilus TaxID=51669 RepID=UPI003BF4E3D5